MHIKPKKYEMHLNSILNLLIFYWNWNKPCPITHKKCQILKILTLFITAKGK